MLIGSVQHDPDRVRMQRDVITEQHDLAVTIARPTASAGGSSPARPRPRGFWNFEIVWDFRVSEF